MKSFGAAMLTLVAYVAVMAAQSPSVEITIARGRFVASVGAELAEPYAGGPWAMIPASELKDGVPATAKGFRIRAWQEAGTTRVVVFAVVTDANEPDRERETQIATFQLSPGQSVSVEQTARYSAAPVTVSAR